MPACQQLARQQKFPVAQQPAEQDLEALPAFELARHEHRLFPEPLCPAVRAGFLYQDDSCEPVRQLRAQIL